MDVTITHTDASAEYGAFIPGPNLNIVPGGTGTWNNVSLADIDGSQRLKELANAGTVTVAIVPDTIDAEQMERTGSLGMMDRSSMDSYTVAGLATITGYEGRLAFASNGRKTGEGGGGGTGVPVYFSNAAWRVFFDDSVVAA